MKRFFCIMLALLLLASTAWAKEMKTARYETVILGKSTETNPPQLVGIAGLKGGEEYEVLAVVNQSCADEQEPWVQAWLDTYVLHQIRYTKPGTGEIVEGYLVAGYVPQDVTSIPEITREYGQLKTVPGRTCETLTFQMIDKWDQGYTLVKPQNGALKMEEALRIALDLLMEKYGETEATLKRLYISYGHIPPSDYSETYYPEHWQFDFFSDLYLLDGYSVDISSADGTVLMVSGPGDGVG